MISSRQTHLNSRALSLQNHFYKQSLNHYLQSFLKEDLGPPKRDITAELLKTPSQKIKAEIIAKQKGIIAGINEIQHCLSQYEIQSTFFLKDGQSLKKGDIVGHIFGAADRVLKLERVVINILQRMSGIATTTQQIVQKLPASVLLCPTRKTYLGLLDKKAVLIGGGGTHRLGLWDSVLIKENHLRVQNYAALIKAVYQSRQPMTFAEIETTTVKEVSHILDCINITRHEFPKKNIKWTIMLDNFPISKIKTMIAQVHGASCLVEVSGNINATNIQQYAKMKPDIISSGALTHSASIIDFSLKVCYI